MPIFMDLHKVPGITAKGVAEAHVQDLLIQNEFSCKCMTYWVDEVKESAFCLIEAPNEEAVRELHNKAHGLMPHQIIQVNEHIVESFLGRLIDPETTDTPEGEIKVFNDPGFRVLVLIKIKDQLFINKEAGKDTGGAVIAKFQEILDQERKNHAGSFAEYDGNISQILSFKATSDAVNFTKAIFNNLSHIEKGILNLKICLNAGLPVTESKFIFGDTIELGEKLLILNTVEPVVVATSVRDHLLRNSDNFTYCTFSPDDEKTILQLFDVLERNIQNEGFDVDDFCKEMALSRSSLNRTTQYLAGKSPNSLIKEYRLNRAFTLLKKNPKNISEIAYNTGFSSPSYFSKCFKTHFNFSPSELEI